MRMAFTPPRRIGCRPATSAPLWPAMPRIIHRLVPSSRARYGRHRYGQSALLARRLIEAGARCVNINTGNWDHHNDIAKGLEEHLPPLDRAIAALVQDLDERGMLSDVAIYCVGEFGRT